MVLEEKKATGGVADYFAILGVGQELVWKHTQKKNGPQEEEEEASLLERFFREIVEVAIIVSNTKKSDDAASISSAASPISPSASQQSIETTTRQGFQMVHFTCPAERGSTEDATAIMSVSTGGYGSVNEASIKSSSTDNNNHNECWSKLQVFDANLDPINGLRGELVTGSFDKRILQTRSGEQSIRGIGQKVGSTLRIIVQDRFKDLHLAKRGNSDLSFHLGYRRRNPGEKDRPAIADLSIRYVRIHQSTLCETTPMCSVGEEKQQQQDKSTPSPIKRGLVTGATIAARVAEAGKHKLMEKYRHAAKQDGGQAQNNSQEQVSGGGAEALFVPLQEFLVLPQGFDEWSIPSEYELLRFPHPDRLNSCSSSRKTFLVPHGENDGGGVGVEAFVDGNSFLSLKGSRHSNNNMPSIFVADDEDEDDLATMDPKVYMPQMLPERLPELSEMEEGYLYIPVVAVRRQRVGDEERFHEDAGIVDMVVSFCDHAGAAVMPDSSMDNEDDEEDEDEEAFSLVGKTAWSRAGVLPGSQQVAENGVLPIPMIQPLGTPLVLVRRNLPLGFADAPFATRVLDRFPLKNYKGLPLPEEELPMFCYPTGCRLHRARFSDCPLAQYYGFVVKNERGDSIHVSCVSFMEPLTRSKVAQLNKISQRRYRTSIPHRQFCDKRRGSRNRRRIGGSTPTGSSVSDLRTHEEAGTSSAIHSETSDSDGKAISDELSIDEDTSENLLLTGFEDMTTFENKTICLISRYPFWTAFRRFLSHLHILSGSSSDLPLERWISHLLLTVPVPKPAGPYVLVPLPTLSGPGGGPMVLGLPPSKDLPLVDLQFHRLLACLDVPTIVTVVLGFLALERKVIVMSTRPSLVLDGCELLRSLLFPFDLCAPYVPRLTQPFMSCLDFPGAIFVGIHDDGTEDGLAGMVRKNLPEDSTIIDLDTGEIDCSGDRYEVLKHCWGVIPSGPRSMLVSEIETLCRDAGIVPGQEPLDSQIDPAFDATIPSTPVEDFEERGDTVNEPFDDRAMRDSFLRFFCSVLGGYERYLVVPDVDFLISGNEWFDAQGFLSSAPQDKAPFLGSLVTTQLFQSFIQRRTEASDVHCLLFDECLAEFHSSPIFGRLGADVETIASPERGQPQMLYSLLVDQCATEPHQHDAAGTEDALSKAVVLKTGGSDTDSSAALLSSNSLDPIRKNDSFKGDTSSTLFAGEDVGFVTNHSGDLVTMPSRKCLVEGSRFVYCVDGNPCFPQKLDSDMFFPREAESLLVELSETPEPLLSRSDREVEEAFRRRKMATSYRGLNNQRRCMWQLPKLMGSHFLGSWLMCVPTQVSQPNLSQDQQSRYLLRALGAMRLMRNRHRIVPDEAAYRALMVACGRSGSDRRVELVKLFGLLRSDGIFPSAVTLGQYTRSIAEGFSKRSTGKPDDTQTDVGSVSVVGATEVGDVELVLNSLDGNLDDLEDSGRRWRQRDGQSPPRKRHQHKSWIPVAFSSSFVPPWKGTGLERAPDSNTGLDKMCVVALWSRTRSCESCAYIPLDEEVQSGWDVVGGELDVNGAVCCPRCGSLMIPKIGYREMTIEEALQIESSNDTVSQPVRQQSIAEESLRKKLASHRSRPVASFDTASTGTVSDHLAKDSSQENHVVPHRTTVQSSEDQNTGKNGNPGNLPPQVRHSIDAANDNGEGVSSVANYVTYVSPAALRASLERHVNERGESVLERETLRQLDPELFYNFLWYCARFSLPLPLAVQVAPESAKSDHPKHYCAFAAWDRTVAERGCRTAARTLATLFGSKDMNRDKVGDQAGDNKEGTANVELFDDFPLLARFNLQSLSQGDWDHPDLSAILVTLVEACDKRDFGPVVACILRCNMRRRERFGLSVPARQNSMDSGSDVLSSSGQGSTDVRDIELDCYRTCLYLAKYQCTTAFHTFFPATSKPCKGYHFWCPTAPLPIFDRLFRDAAKRIRSKDSSFTPVHDVSDVALGFRCVFGHLI